MADISTKADSKLSAIDDYIAGTKRQADILDHPRQSCVRD